MLGDISSSHPALINALVASIALGSACAVLSVFVVLRRWAFIGEGISHSGFAGAGAAWLLALAVPQMDRPAAPTAGIILACIATAFLIGHFSRSGRLNPDAAIGIFLVASLAFGFLAKGIYQSVRHAAPAGWDAFLLGELLDISRSYMLASVAASAGTIAVILLLKKEIVLYCFDPTAAQVSGVRTGFVHFLLMLLVSLMIIIGIRIAGPLLVTALLVLPGATALLLSSRLSAVMTISVGVGLIGGVGGLALNLRYTFIPAGPAIVLILFLLFLLGNLLSLSHRRVQA